MTPDETVPVVCPQCGRECKPAENYCPMCGANLENATAGSAAQEQRAAKQSQGDSDAKEHVTGGSAVAEAGSDDGTPITVPVEERSLVMCACCGYPCRAGDATCPKCGCDLNAPDTERLLVAQQAMISTPVEPYSVELFEPGTNAILQLNMSGGWLSLGLEEPLILGRGPSVTGEKMLDLTDFGGYEQGMSRRHCMLRRSGNNLKIADLGSANGTYLNGKQLIPHVDYIVRHGDQLMLGRLPVTILFSIIKLSDN